MSRPTDDITWGTSGSAEITEPSLGQKILGWIHGRKPAAGWENWFKRAYYRWIGWFDDSFLGLAAGNWTSRSSGFGGDQIKSFAYGATRFVAVGANGKLASSDNNGFSWTIRTSQFSTSTINHVIFANSLFVAVGADGKISTSPDGITWTARTSGFSTDAISFVMWSSSLSLFIAGGANGKISTSPDGITWTARTANFGTATVAKIIQHGAILIAVGGAGKISTSADGITWTARTSGLSGSATIDDIATNGSIAIATSQVDNKLISSTDGITWTLRYTSASSIHAAIWTGTAFVVADTFESFFLRSTDGITWVTHASPYGGQVVAAFGGLTLGYGSKVLVAFDASGFLSTSVDDGVTWTGRGTMTAAAGDCGIFANGVHLLGDNAGGILSSLVFS